MAVIDITQLITAGQSAKICNITERRFMQLNAEGKGPKPYLIGKRKFYLRDEVIEWNRERKGGS